MYGRSEREIIADEAMQKKLQKLPQIFTDFYNHMYSSKSYRTIESYIAYVKEFAEYICKDDTIDSDFYKKVKSTNINEFLVNIDRKKKKAGIMSYSDNVRSIRWSALNCFFSFCVETDLIKENPVARTKRPQVKDNTKIEFLTRDEINGITANIEAKAEKKIKTRDLAFFGVGITTGLRASALIQINKEDVNLQNNTIKVIEKGGKYFTAHFGENTKKLLLDWLEYRDKYFSDCDTNALFVSKRKKRMSIETASILLKKYAEGVTDKNLHAHIMRHTCATQIYEATNDIYLASAVLNHKKISTTQRYAAMADEKKEIAVNILDDML